MLGSDGGLEIAAKKKSNMVNLWREYGRDRVTIGKKA
jgi:hypothetical protein